MSNDIDIKVTMEDFEHLDHDKKLNLIYRAVSAQQAHCNKTVAKIEDNIRKIDKPIRMNTKKVAGVGIGSGAVGGFIAKLPDIIDAFGTWLHK